jgi:hypothetical protein
MRVAAPAIGVCEGMSRHVSLQLSPDQAKHALDVLTEMQGVLSLSHQKGTSVNPPGDVITAELVDRSLPHLMRELDDMGMGNRSDMSVTLSQPTGLVGAQSAAIADVPASATLEEMDFTMARQSTMGVDNVFVMAAAGAIAAVGIATNSIHVVVGAMILAPGFQPLMRAALGLATRSAGIVRGLKDTAIGYGCLIAGAAVASLMLRLLGVELPADTDGYLDQGALVAYWSSLTPAATMATVAAAAAGALIIASTRSELTAGAMVALALVPAATMISMGAVAGAGDVAVNGLVRLLHDAAIVVLVGSVVYAIKSGWRSRTVRL